jgi:hypothetical protein
MEAALVLYLGLSGTPIEVLMPDITRCREAIVEAIRDFGPVKAECLTGGPLIGPTIPPSRSMRWPAGNPCFMDAILADCRRNVPR